MLRPLRIALVVAALICAPAPALAQINWTVAYSDGPIQAGGFGFADPTPAGSTTVGQLRRDSVTASLNYWNTILDGRGTIPIRWNVSQNVAPGPNGVVLGSFGRSGSSGFTTDGYFMAGPMYERARSGTSFTSGAAGSGQINFNSGVHWHYDVPGTDTTLNGSTVDLISVLTHEIGHGLAFSSNVTNPTTGRGRNPAGTAPNFPPPNPFTVGTDGDWYSTYDGYTQRGNGAFSTSALIRTDVTQSNYATFTGPASTYTGGNENPTGSNPSNNTTSGLYFGGPFTREVFGGPVPLYSPGSFQSGSSISHVNATPLGLMNWEIDSNTTRRLQPYEIAMLLDMGWNVYNWDSSSGNWRDGVTGTAPNETLSLGDSRWRTDKGIVLAADGFTSYNTFSHQAQAPVLPPYGQVTSNIVLNFGGSGSSGYVSANDLGNIRVARLNLNSTAAAPNTIANAAGNPNGTLIFGVNSDGTPSILTPKIVQQNAGQFAVNVNLQITDTTAAGGWAGLTVDGPGTGQVTLGGTISGTGSLTKAGTFTAVVSGNNTYTGGTTVTAGTLRLGAANVLPDTGTVTLAGGTLSTGAGAGNSDVVGGLTLSASSTLNLGTGNHSITFTGLVGAPTGVLTITGWTGDRNASGTAGDVLFGNIGVDPNVDHLDFLRHVQFAGFDLGGATFLFVSGTTYELVPTPVPEPGMLLGIAFGTLAIGAGVRRLRRNLNPTPPGDTSRAADACVRFAAGYSRS
jgi:autotransporter-associated beta strand protein